MTKKKKIALLCLNAALLALLGFCVWQCRGYETTLQSQQAAKYWTGESAQRFSQLSCFFPQGSGVTPETVNTFRKTIDKKLSEAGVEPPAEGESWNDAYAAINTISVTSEHADTTATAVAVGGDFFAFHPYRLLSGSYIREDDLMKDRVVIDRELAWQLFGGTQLAGMTVEINGKPFYIAGVIERESDKFTQRAFAGQQSDAENKTGGTPPMLFMSYAAYTVLNDSSSDGGDIVPPAADGKTAASNASSGDGGAGLSCYEIVLPNPIAKFGANLVSEGFKAQSPIVVENSDRYRFANIWSIFKSPGARSVVTSPVVFPYWENAARVSEDYVAREYVFIALLGVFPLICLVWLLVRLIRFLTGKIKRLCFNIWDAWDDRYGRKQAREQTKAMRAAVIEAVESGELPPEELPPETAEEKLEAFFGKTKRETEKAEEKTKSFFSRLPKPKKSAAPEAKTPKAPCRAAKKPKLPGKKSARRPSAEARTAESAASLLSEFERMDVERIVQEVLDEENAQNIKK